MISVGIDVSKDKSTVCILKPYGEIIKAPFEISHTESELNALSKLLLSFNDEVRVIMEATGYYHLPILNHLLSKNIFVCVVNALVMNKYCNITLRKGKTDKKDAIKIANYGLDFWFRLNQFRPNDSVYEELNFLSRQYHQVISVKVKYKIILINLLDKTMPKITELLSNNSKTPEKCKLNDFVKRFWHYDNIAKLSQKQFVSSYNNWAKKSGYQQSESKAVQIYALAKEGIPTISSTSPSTKLLVLETVRMLEEIEHSLNLILTQMEQLAKQLEEYSVVSQMNGVGKKLSLLLIAEIGDINRFHNAKALIAYAGIDSPPHQSGTFQATKRHISKRGCKYLRSVGYEIMTAINKNKNENCQIYNFMQKKVLEGKPKNVAKIAGLNKFLRIYYAKVKEII
jgi:transposase